MAATCPSLVFHLMFLGNIWSLSSADPDASVRGSVWIYQFKEPLPATTGERINVRLGDRCFVRDDGTNNCDPDMCDKDRHHEPVCKKRDPEDDKPVCQCVCSNDAANIGEEECDFIAMVNLALRGDMEFIITPADVQVNAEVFVSAGTVFSNEPDPEIKLLNPEVGWERGEDGGVILDLGLGVEFCQPTGGNLRSWVNMVLKIVMKMPIHFLHSIVRSMRAEELVSMLDEQTIRQIVKIAK